MHLRKRIWIPLAVLAALVLLAAAAWVLRDPLLEPFGIDLPSGRAEVIDLELPAGFRANLYADELVGPRGMTLTPDGVPLLAERSRSRVVALPDDDGDGVADRTVVLAEDLDRPSSLAWRPGTNQLYVGETTRVTRLELDGLEVVARDVPIDGLPGLRIHFTTTVLFRGPDELFVSMGSSCNVCEEGDARLATVARYDPDSGERSEYATGLRNAVGLAVEPVTGAVWASNNGRDLMGDDLPPETFYALSEGLDAGWPRCHAGTIPDPDFGDVPEPCAGVAMPVAVDTAHSAPLGIAFYDLPPGAAASPSAMFPRPYRGDLYVAHHGSWNRSVPTGYEVVRIPVDDGAVTGPPEPFAGGWLAPDGSSSGRPVDVIVAADGALLISDDKAGAVYRVAYRR